MISFELFTMDSASPIYLQILRFIKRGIVSGSIRDGDDLPSRRVLSSRLGINPNTVQKAYRMLEEEGLIESHSGTKSCVSLNGATVSRVRAELMESDVLSVVSALKQAGLTKEDALRLMDENWEDV